MRTNKNKMLYISASMIPSEKANAVHVIRMCDAFAEIGFDVMLLCKTMGKREQINEYYGVSDRVKLKNIPIPFRGFFLLLYGFIAALYTVLYRADVVYSRNLFASFFLVFMGARHHFEIHHISGNKVIKSLIKIVCQKLAGKIIVITPKLAEDLSLFFDIDKDKILICSDAASPNQYAFNTSIKENMVVYTGSLYKGKGIETILKVANRLPLVKFAIAGGPTRYWGDFYRDLSSENVTYLGWLKSEDIKKLQSSASILLLPNSPDVFTNDGKDNIGKYTSPLKLFEYMASGRPIIASSIEAYSYIFANTDPLAVLVPPDSIDDWEKSINSLISNHSLQEVLARNAYSLFLKQFTWVGRAKNIIAQISVR